MSAQDHPPKSFQCLTQQLLADYIGTADHRLIYIGPGMTKLVATACVHSFNHKQDASDFECKIVLDTNPDIFRLGYGESNSLEIFEQSKIPVMKQSGIRIGCLVVDFSAWIFTPTPLLVEDPKDVKINAIKITYEEAIPLIQSILGSQSSPPEVGPECLTTTDVKSIQKDLEDNPPQSFDLARKIRVFSSKLEYVDFHVSKTQLSRFQVSIDSKLLGGLTKNAQERVNTTWKLFSNSGRISTDWITERRKKITNKYLRQLGKPYGNVILKTDKADFLKDVNKLDKDIKDFDENKRDAVRKELEKTKEQMLQYLRRPLFKNPPEELMRELVFRPSKPEDLDPYILSLLKIPTVDEVMQRMEVTTHFKSISPENLDDEEFKQSLKKTYPHVNWTQFFSESDAITPKQKSLME